MDALLEKLMNGTRTVPRRPDLATGLLAALVVVVRSHDEAEG